MFKLNTMANINLLVSTNELIARQLTTLDKRVSRLSQKVFETSNQSKDLHLLLQLSVTEGVRGMYAQVLHKTRKKVLDGLSQADDVVVDQATTDYTSSTPECNTKTDKAAVPWTCAFCESFRAS